MAAPKTYVPRPSHRFLPSNQASSADSSIFEFDESEVWNWNNFTAVTAPSLDFLDVKTRKPPPVSAAAAAAASLPVNIPDWSKILKEEYRESRDYGDFDDAGDDWDRVPPHEFLARSRNASSVHQGIGRTLKGRDLSRVRNAVWRKTGFLG